MLVNLAPLQITKTLNKDVVDGSMFKMGDVLNAKDGIQAFGNVGRNYVTLDHAQNLGTTVFTLQNLAPLQITKTLNNDVVEGSWFKMGDIANAEDGIQAFGNVGKNYVTIDNDRNYGTTVFTLQNLAPLQITKTLNNDVIEGSFFNMGDIANAPDGIVAFGNVGKNYVTVDHLRNYGTSVFTL